MPNDLPALDLPALDLSALDLSALPTVFPDVPRPDRSARDLPSVPALSRQAPDRRRSIMLARGRRAVEYLAPLPRPGEEIFGVLDATFGGFDLVAAVVELIDPATVTRLDVSTLGFSRENTTRLAELLDAGRIQACRFVVSDYYRAADNSAYSELRAMLADRGHSVAVCRTHCKIALLATSDGRQLTIEGSMNFRTCNAYEQFILTSDPAVYAYRMHAIDVAAQTAATEGKPDAA